MTCPTCNGQLAMLFTSTYCPACERARESTPEPPIALRGKNNSLLVGDDGGVWWRRSDGKIRLTYGPGLGPIVAFQITTDRLRLLTIERAAVSGGRWVSWHRIDGIPGNIGPESWQETSSVKRKVDDVKHCGCATGQRCDECSMWVEK